MTLPHAPSRIFTCAWCQKQGHRAAGSINRAKKQGAPLYCDKTCAGMARRVNKTSAEKKEAKRLYDMKYRERNFEQRAAQKAEYHRLTYNPAKARAERKARARAHAEYCRRPEYKAWKRVYDIAHRARRDFGQFCEAALILRDIELEIDQRATRYEICQINGTMNKAQTRRRAL